jgi:hypothetical protein
MGIFLRMPQAWRRDGLLFDLFSLPAVNPVSLQAVNPGMFLLSDY